MKVILREEVESLGGIGQIVSVKDGYARNFLIPKKFAVAANEKNKKALEHELRVIESRRKKVRLTADELKAKIEAVRLVLKAKAGEEEKLFGSVTSMDIAEGLKAMGIEVDRKKIVLDQPIKRLGEHTVGLKIHPEVTAEFKVEVRPE